MRRDPHWACSPGAHPFSVPWASIPQRCPGVTPACGHSLGATQDSGLEPCCSGSSYKSGLRCLFSSTPGWFPATAGAGGGSPPGHVTFWTSQSGSQTDGVEGRGGSPLPEPGFPGTRDTSVPAPRGPALPTSRLKTDPGAPQGGHCRRPPSSLEATGSPEGQWPSEPLQQEV